MRAGTPRSGRKKQIPAPRPVPTQSHARLIYTVQFELGVLSPVRRESSSGDVGAPDLFVQKASTGGNVKKCKYYFSQFVQYS